MTGKHFVNRDVPEHRNGEIPHVLFLALRRPATLDVGQVVIGAAWFALEGPRRPHARKRPPVELGRRLDDNRLVVGDGDNRLTAKELLELFDMTLRNGDER